MATMPLAEAIELARRYRDANDPGNAETVCRSILVSYPAQPDALEILARSLLQLGRADEALAVYRDAVSRLWAAVAPNNIAFSLSCLRNLGFRPQGILDVGAYEGQWAEMAHQVFPDAYIFMVEAQEEKRSALKRVADQHHGAMGYEIALLGAEARASVPFFQMQTPYGSTGSSVYEEQTQFARTATALPMRTLDDVLAAAGSRAYQLLKLDVQGAELDVLRGAPRALRDVEVLVSELSLVPYNKGAPLIADVVGAFQQLGFSLFDIVPVRRIKSAVLLQVDGVFLRTGSALWPQPPFF